MFIEIRREEEKKKYWRRTKERKKNISIKSCFLTFLMCNYKKRKKNKIQLLHVFRRIGSCKMLFSFCNLTRVKEEIFLNEIHRIRSIKY